MGPRGEPSCKQALEGPAETYVVNEGDGASTGRRLTSTSTDAIGRKWQCATIQLDYQLPERFDLNYVGADNTEHRPVVIHRAIFGSFERFIALLIEHYAGRAAALALAGAGDGAADRRPACGVRGLRARSAVGVGLAVEVDDRQEKIGYKIREAQLQKVPYMLVVGDKEMTTETVAVRSRSRGDLGARLWTSSSRMRCKRLETNKADAVAAAVEGVRPSAFSIQHSAL